MKLAALLGALATYTHTHTQAEVIHRTMFGLLHPLVALATVYHCFVQARIHYQTRQFAPNTMECALRAPPPPPPPEHSATGRAHLYPDAQRAPYIRASLSGKRCVVLHEEE